MYVPPLAANASQYAALRRAAGWRLALFGAVLAGVVGLHSTAHFKLDWATAYLYSTIGIGVVYAFAVWAWLWRRESAGVGVVLLTVTVDLTAAAALAALTGGTDSIFGFLFAIVIVEAASFWGGRGSLLTATVSSIAYLVIALMHAEGLLFTSDFLRLGTPPAAGSDVWLYAALRIFAFYLVALLAGQIALRLGWLEQQQQRLLENFATGYIATDLRGRLTFINSAGRRILGLGEKPVLGMTLDAIFEMDAPRRDPVTLSRELHKEFYEMAFDHQRADGRCVPLQMTTAFIRSRGHKIGGVMAHFSDQTQVHELERMVRQRDRLALAGELSASLAHEVRNPVAAIRSAAQELRPGAEGTAAAVLTDDPVEQKLLDIIQRESDQLNRVVTHFLEYARVAVEERHPVKIATVIEEIVDGLRRCPSRLERVTVEYDWQPSEITVSGDAGLLKQALLNLIHNAIEAMPEGGTLLLSAKQTARGDAAQVVVQDTGCGIAPEQMGSLFQPFFTTKSAGTGLGLAVVHRIVTAHNGTIEVTSTPGVGTRMRVTLPAID